MNTHCPFTGYTTLQSQKAVTAHLKSEQLQPFDFARQSTYQRARNMFVYTANQPKYTLVLVADN